MKAAIIKSPKILNIVDVEIPEIGPSDVLVKVHSVGICGSDVHGFVESSFRRAPGLIMGHEFAGMVAKVGSAVNSVHEGDRVAIDPHCVCGTCYACQQGWYNICDNKQIIGSSSNGMRHGAMAEYVAVDARQVYLLPDSVSALDAAMIEPLGNAIHVMNRAKINGGESVVIIGAGTLGLCMIQAARVAGAGKIIVIDVSDFRLGIAGKLGANVTINSSLTDPIDQVRQQTGNRGADIVVEAVGIDATYRQAIAMVRKRGSVMFFGAVQELVTVDLYPILHKELNLIGCTGFSSECSTAIELIALGRVSVKEMITHRFPLSQAQDAFDLLFQKGNTAIKVLLHP